MPPIDEYPSREPVAAHAAVERVFREAYGRVVAVLVRSFGDIDVAQDMVADAFLTALEQWPVRGTPPSPAAWIITTARNRTIDRLRREATRDAHHAQFMAATYDAPELAVGLHGQVEPTLAIAVDLMRADGVDEPDRRCDENGEMHDDRLRLMFTCCHPALAVNVQIALTLRLLGGLTTAEIARAFLVPEATMAQRIVRAKAKIRDARIPYRVPDSAALPARVHGVLHTLYLVFNEGYVATAGDSLTRESLCAEGIRLARLVHRLLPGHSEAAGLLAMMLLIHARRHARSADGALVPLRDQPRDSWDRVMIAEGHALVRECLRRNSPGAYQLQAAIQAVHTDAAHASDTDWSQILTLYDQLLALRTDAVVTVHRAVAVAEVQGARAGLIALEQQPLVSYYIYHAVRAELLERLGEFDDAALAYARASTLTQNEAERRFLLSKQVQVTQSIA
jgi:RNA polymerase sigma-70 factor (ECF subfamily)